MNRKTIQPKEELTIQFFENRKNPKSRPVGRYEGKVAFISKKSGDFIKPGSSWICRVEEVRDKYLIVMPLVIWKTAEQNKLETIKKLSELQSKYAK